MGTELTLDVGTLYSFLLVLARISGAFIFVPIPGIQAGPQIARAVIAVSMTLALEPRWPTIDPSGMNILLLTGWLLAEGGMGLAVGLLVAFLFDTFQMGAQIISLQAGYSFASTVDPTSGADSSVLISISQTAAGLIFFATGMDRQILRAFADSLSSQPPGHFSITLPMVYRMIQAGASIFSTGLRLVLPLLALLLMVETLARAADPPELAIASDAALLSHQNAALADVAGLAALDIPPGFRAFRRPHDATDHGLLSS